jgi:protocatechuate 3,4-dioxygenase beta subunit
MMRSFALVFFLFDAILSASAQPPASTPSASSTSISGAVVKEPGDQPLKKVLVQVVAENRGENYTASTDADGHFHIENIAPGRYRLFIERTGFAGVNERGLKSDTNVFTVQAGQSMEDLLFRMSPTSAISGRITDEDGDPMSGVRVVALKKVHGKAKPELVGTEASNDLGEYRLSGLFPGQYLIAAMPPPDFRDYQQQKKPDNQADNKDTRYLTTYYPGTYDSSQASPVALSAGDDMPINLMLVPSRTYRVRGTVTGLPAGEKPLVELISKIGDSIHANEVNPDGQFEVRGVGPGSYVLRASSGNESRSLTTHQEVNVVAADVEGLKLAPQPSFTLSGHLHFEAGASGDFTQYAVNLRQAELPEDPGIFMSQEFFGANAPVDRLGNFEWKNVNPGNYILQLYGGDGQNGVFLKSVRLGSHDVDAGFAAGGPATLEVIVSFKGGAVEGDVVDKKAEKEKDSTDQLNNERPVTNATVVAVPEEKYRNIPGRFGIGETDQHGHFAIRGLAPGTYTLYAWLDVDERVYRDPDFLKSQEANETALKVEESSHQTIELGLSTVGEEWR